MAVAGLRNVSVFGPSSVDNSQHHRPSNRASTLLQIWREIEGEHLASPSCESRQHRNGSNSECLSSMSVGQGSDNGDDISQDSDDIMNPSFIVSEIDREDNSSVVSEQSSDLGEIERERVRQIFKEWMSNGSKGGFNLRNRSGQWLGENECERVRIIREWVQKTSQERNNCGSVRDEAAAEGGSEIEQVRDRLVLGCARRTNRRLCGRQTLVDLLLRIQSERKRELLGLSELSPVSNFAHRNRIQALLKGRFLRNERLVPDERPSSTAATELGLLRQRHAVSDLREEFLSKFDSSASTSLNTDSASTTGAENKDELEFKCREMEDADDPVASELEHAPDGDQHLQLSEVQVTEPEVPVRNNEGTELGVSPGDGSANSRDEQVMDSGEQQQEMFMEAEHGRIAEQSDGMVSNDRLLESEEMQSSGAVDGYDESGRQRVSEGCPGEVNDRDTDVEGHTNEGFDSHTASAHADELQESGNEIGDDTRSWHESSGHQWSPGSSHNNIDDQDQMQESHHDWQNHDSQEPTIDGWLHTPGEVSESFGRLDAFHFHHGDDGDVRRTELNELFSRRRVSSLLDSGFRESLDQVLQSHAERLGHASDDWEHDNTSQGFTEQDQEQFNVNQTPVESDGFETNPLPPSTFLAASRPFWGEEFPSVNWTRQISSLQPGTEWEVINELKIDIARLHQRMNNMQSMLEECMDMQIELQRSVRQEVSAALNRTNFSRDQVPDNQMSDESDRWDHVRKGVCCLCRDSKIDSLLCRCGHMCTCSKCAENLMQHKGKCPMCRAPIVEVVRAYFIQ